MSRAIYRMLAEAREQRDAAFELLRQVLAEEKWISERIGNRGEPKYVAAICELVGDVPAAAPK